MFSQPRPSPSAVAGDIKWAQCPSPDFGEVANEVSSDQWQKGRFGTPPLLKSDLQNILLAFHGAWRCNILVHGNGELHINGPRPILKL